MRLFLALLLWLGAAAQAPAQTAVQAPTPTGAPETVVAAVNQAQVAITTDFVGSEIFIYGAVRRMGAPPDDGPLDVIVVISGPARPALVRRKERTFGIWINNAGVRIGTAPTFYAVSTTRPLRDIISHTEELRHKIGLDHVVRLIGPTHADRHPEEYREALIRLRRKAGLYLERPGGVSILGDTLFRTSVALPAQLVEGDYAVRIFLLRNLQVVDISDHVVEVTKVGFERWIHSMAREQSLLYGLMSIAVALVAGWLASTFFRVFLP